MFLNTYELPIFVDFDGCIAQHGKAFYEKYDHDWVASEIYKIKLISDHDGALLKKLSHRCIVLSKDWQINQLWCKNKGIRFHYCIEDKYSDLEEIFNSIYPSVDPHQNYCYLGDSMDDFECLENSRIGYIPRDASDLLKYKINKNKLQHIKLIDRDSGSNVFEKMCLSLMQKSVFSNEDIFGLI